MEHAEDPLKVVLCWHMHQPEYRDLDSGTFRFPWTYLHALKDYVDMAAHLEAQADARAVVNFSPLLLDQIADYAAQLDDCIDNGAAPRDPLLAALAAPTLPTDADHRLSLIQSCLRVNEARVIDRFPGFRRLARVARTLVANPDVLIYISNQFFADLLVWYHLGWMGETVRRSEPVIKQLQEQEQAFSLHDRRRLLQVMRDLLHSIVPRFRRLAESGQVELAFSPYAHPMLPLLLDLRTAREAMPDATLPLVQHYPGGAQRVRWHLQEGIESFQRHFGFAPSGCWPSEGGLSEPALAHLAEQGLRWCASGETVLRNSVAANAEAEHPHTTDACRHRVYRFADHPVDCFFRDDGLSDLIGFSYADWHADDAVADLLQHLERIGEHCSSRDDCVVSIILDGENAWEYYPENAYHFLNQLYRGIAEHPGLELTTFSRFLDGGPARETLPSLVSGSWVYGTFSTWIGDDDKNRGWDLLAEAKHHFDEVVASGVLESEQRRLAERQLAVCEGSDWFWWFGDYNPADSVRDFDALFRLHLSRLYHCLGLEPPAHLTRAISHGSGAPSRGGVMRRGQEGADGA